MNPTALALRLFSEPLALEAGHLTALHLRFISVLTHPQPQASPALQPLPSAIPQAAAHERPTLAAPPRPANGAPPSSDAPYFWSPQNALALAIIPVYGVLAKGADFYEEAYYGMVNPDRIAHALAQAVTSPQVTAILFDFNSPGGFCIGIPELAAQIAEASQVKAVYAWSEGVCASAAYWLASQCSAGIYTTPTARIGSIGTVLSFVNPKGLMDKLGLKLEAFYQGTHKITGAAGRDLTKADSAYLQGTVDTANEQFLAAVISGRPDASEEALTDAKVYTGENAVEQGLVDATAPTWTAFLQTLLAA